MNATTLKQIEKLNSLDVKFNLDGESYKLGDFFKIKIDYIEDLKERLRVAYTNNEMLKQKVERLNQEAYIEVIEEWVY